MAMRTVLRDLGINLWAGLRLALWLPLRTGAFRVSVGAFVALALFNVAVWFAADLARAGWPGEIQWSALETYLAQMALVLLAAFVIGLCYGQHEPGLGLAVMWLAPVWLFEWFAATIAIAVGRGVMPLPLPDGLAWMPSVEQVYATWVLVTAVRAVALAVPWRHARFVAAAGIACALTAMLNVFMARPELWRELLPPPLARTPGIEREAAFHAQSTLLGEMLAAVNPGRPGVIDLYFLGVAAYGAQDVFLREVRSVRALFDERFDTAGRSLVLVNNNATLTDTPIATLTNVRAALRGFAERMNRDEDVLLLFLTTHGDVQHRLEVDLWPLVLDPITPQALALAVKQSAIKWKVLVISACYSGGFVEALRDPYTVVITAADAQSTSFGCAHENDWTYFGEAYFAHGLRRTRSFIDAFGLARQRVTQREQAEQLAASNPQLHVGEAIRARLQSLEVRLDAAN